MADVGLDCFRRAVSRTHLKYTVRQQGSRVANKNEIATVVFDKKHAPGAYDVMVPRNVKHRIQVGSTNRWRNDTIQKSDILGTNQELKSVATAYNSSLMQKITAESASSYVNTDMSEPYKFRQDGPKRVTMPAQFVAKEKSLGGMKDIKQPGLPRFHPGGMRECNPVDILKYFTHKGRTFSGPGLAVALGNLYHEDLEVDEDDLAEVLGAATLLKFAPLQEHCARRMVKAIKYTNVCAYHDAAVRYHQEAVESACERWLLLNLVPQLGTQIQLRELNMRLLTKLVNSPQLFVYNEYSIYKVLTYWLFLQLNPTIQLMPTHSTVVAFYNGYNSHTGRCLLETPECTMYEPLFSNLKLNGVIDSDHVNDIQKMNVIPEKWIIDFLAHHYHSLQSGGDMGSSKHFDQAAVRHGFILDEEPQFHSEVFSLHGFHLMLHASHSPDTGVYEFYMKRLKPNDPVLSFRQCERQTFSLRPDRLVVYSIRVQHVTPAGEHKMYNTGSITQRFGLSSESRMSQVLTLEDLHPPIYIIFKIIFPMS